MKSVMMLAIVSLFAVCSLSGCQSSAGSATLGALGGAAAGAGGYELHLKNQKDRIDEDLKSGKITQQEYDIRKSQIERDSLLQ